MSRKIEDGGPAGQIGGFGMTLRDYFAAQALQTTVLAANTFETETAMASTKVFDDAAKLAYMAADAMLRARNELKGG